MRFRWKYRGSVSEPVTHTAEVLIVGGGPAGLAAAEAAAQGGAKTVVLERQKEIGYPIHTSGGSWIQVQIGVRFFA